MGESFPLTDIFQRGWNHQPVKANINNQQGWSHLFCWMRRGGWTYWNTRKPMVGNPFFWVLHGSGWNLFHGSFYIHYKYAQVLPFVVRPITKCCYIPLSLVVCIQASVASTQLSVVSLIISTFEFFFLWLSTHILFLWHIPTARWPCSVSPSSINMSRLGIVCWHSYHPWLLPIPQRFGPRNQGIFFGEWNHIFGSSNHGAL